MEQLYLIEIFVDKVSIIQSTDGDNGANKNLIVKTKFGPNVQFIVREGQLAVIDEKGDDIVECDERGNRKWSRTIRVGKSYLFPSYPDTVLMMLSKFPLEIEVWNDDEKEQEIFVGVGTMYWDTEFYVYLKDSADACKLHEPLAVKQNVLLYAECCCKLAGDIDFILRISALGDTITTEFQQLMSDPDKFCFRTNKAPSMFQCQRIEGDNPNFCMIGSLYETTTLEDPSVIANANRKIEICTELDSCGFHPVGTDTICHHTPEDKSKKKQYPIDKIKMGDIKGPCGNANCALAQKIRNYIRNLEAYKKQIAANPPSIKGEKTRKICGSCDCKDDRYHRGTCDEGIKVPKEKVICKDCGGVTDPGHTCEDNVDKMFGTGLTPRGPSPTESPTKQEQVNYMTITTRPPELMQSLFGKDFVVGNFSTKYDISTWAENQTLCSQGARYTGCCCSKINMTRFNGQVMTTVSTPNLGAYEDKTPRNIGFVAPLIYNAQISTGKDKYSVYNCIETSEDKECKCNPPKLSPPCKTFDCDCLTENINIAARKKHKPYCPSYKHKVNCPVTMMNDEEEKKEEEDEEAEPLPYGLPPIQLGPCPVLGRPCTVPDGFARMYKTGASTTLPPSYSEAGKVCCSKEYERIKKAIKEYMKNDKDNDFRCINKFNVDTERRCCDKEQLLLSLMGKGCCGSHKMSIQEKYTEKK